MVAAESDLAAKAGVEILKRGGNAIDAAVATSLALGVTNASSCGIGGGGFMLIYWKKTGTIYALDYRERAPMAAHADMYVRNGKPDEELAVSGPLAVAVPGEIAGLDTALRRFWHHEVPAGRGASDKTRARWFSAESQPRQGTCHGGAENLE